MIGDGRQDADDFAFGQADLSHNRSFTYVPKHLRFSCDVLLQNACYSVAHRHASLPAEERSEPMQPVRAVFAHGQHEVSVKVSDEGGGIPRRRTDLAWSYFCSPSKSGWRHSQALGAGNPIGAGLPLARLHARYYGGDLIMKTIDGFGTDAYLFLNRLGEHCEKLPPGVRLSPAMRDSSLGKEAAMGLESLGEELSRSERVLLKRRLAEFRSKPQALLANLSSLSSAP